MRRSRDRISAYILVYFVIVHPTSAIRIFWYEEILEMIRALQLLIRNDISWIRGKKVGLPDD